MNDIALVTLEEISSIPTATFFEERVTVKIEEILRDLFIGNERVQVKRDPHQDLIVHYSGDPNREKPKSVAFVMHTDHPAFHIHHTGSDFFEAKLMGGLNRELIVGSRLKLHGVKKGQEMMGYATVIREIDPAEGNPAGRYVIQADGSFQLNPAFATLDLPGFEVKNGIIQAPVLDDFASIGMGIEALNDIVENETKTDVYLVFHRAEEVGFIGAYIVASSDILPEDTIIYSVETSSYKGKRSRTDLQPEEIVKVGEGVIIRTGDRTSPIYNIDALSLAHVAALSLEGHKIQEARMFAGTCEASMYYAQGWRSAGICLPLIAWHNDGKLEGQEEMIREGVSVIDFTSGTALLTQIPITLDVHPSLYTRINKPDLSPEHQRLISQVGQMVEGYKNQGFF